MKNNDIKNKSKVFPARGNPPFGLKLKREDIEIGGEIVLYEGIP